MEGFVHLIGDWHFWAIAVAYYLFMSLVGGMVEPIDADPRWYKWMYNSAHIFSGNLAILVGSRFKSFESNVSSRKVEYDGDEVKAVTMTQEKKVSPADPKKEKE